MTPSEAKQHYKITKCSEQQESETTEAPAPVLRIRPEDVAQEQDESEGEREEGDSTSPCAVVDEPDRESCDEVAAICLLTNLVETLTECEKEISQIDWSLQLPQNYQRLLEKASKVLDRIRDKVPEDSETQA